MRWPTREVLLAWFLHTKLDENATPAPAELEKWVYEFEGRTHVGLHKELYAEYEDFRKEFFGISG